MKIISNFIQRVLKNKEDKVMARVYLTLDMYKMGRDKQFPNEWTKEVETNAIDLIARINAILNEINWSKSVSVSSGFRPAAINGATSNAAKKSLHMTGMACDLLDSVDQELSKLIMSKPDLLKKHGLWLEHPDATKGKNTNWAHLDINKARTDRPIRVFKP